MENTTGTDRTGNVVITALGIAGSPDTIVVLQTPPTGVNIDDRIKFYPKVYKLLNSFPNPSNGNVTFRYQLPKESKVTLEIYNISGQLIERINIGYQGIGNYNHKWCNKNLSNGIYIYRLIANDYTATRKMIYIK